MSFMRTCLPGRPVVWAGRATRVVGRGGGAAPTNVVWVCNMMTMLMMIIMSGGHGPRGLLGEACGIGAARRRICLYDERRIP